MPPKGSNPDRLGRLILKAVRSLPQREQDEVLASLLGRSATPGPIHPRFAPHPTEAFGVPTPDPIVPTTRQMDQPLLVRLPAELHGRLREWATTHGFSMAAVARGLIERFLEEQRSS